MSTSSTKRAGKERIQSLGIPKNRFSQWWSDLHGTGLWSRIAMVLTASALMMLICRTWEPPFPYRTGDYPPRDMVSRVDFQVPDEAATEALRIQKRRETLVYYVNRSQPLHQRREELKDQLFLVLGAQSFEQMTPEERRAFSVLYEEDETAGPGDTAADRFAVLKSVLSGDTDLAKTDDAVRIALLPASETGLLQSLTHTAEQGDLRVIRVYAAGNPDDAQAVEVSKVRIAQAKEDLEQRLKEQFRQRFDGEPAQKVAAMINHWLSTRMPETLSYDDELSSRAREEMASRVEPVMKTYRRGVTPLARAGESLHGPQIELLRQEWKQLTTQIRWPDRIARLTAYAGMIFALFLLCGAYIYFVNDRTLIADIGKLARLLTFTVAAIALCYHASGDKWRAELIPLAMASITATVVYGRELAMLLMAAISLSITLFIGSDVAELVMMAAACTTCILLLGRIRSRTHLMYVGLGSGAITAATVVGVGIVTGQLFATGETISEVLPITPSIDLSRTVAMLLAEAWWAGGCVVVASLVMTGLLPLVEKGFSVQTDLSLLELGDASHPLLRRLAQRAPGTYNHSINVASIAEAAADAIGANGLLVRVGAYFHDIGKMFKPEYFIENQSQGKNQHDSLQPAMSTLVIIAHVKDGADLARTNHLPKPIIDFILQHHGTTLVEYFYREAAKRSEANPNREEVSDKDFRYPGPKPQTLEAAVLMLADTVESASRTLVDPTSARIAGLVDTIAEKKMADGQFDQCGMTFKQFEQVKASLVKTLTSIYHGRVKYPGQQSA
ncbi:MAG: HD family phosphohydrolase [Planctomycetaceae bacterium]